MYKFIMYKFILSLLLVSNILLSQNKILDTKVGLNALVGIPDEITTIAKSLKSNDDSIGSSLLLIGPSGTGKTSMVKALAHDTKRLLITRDAIVTKYAGSGEAAINELLEFAISQNQPVIIFLDEVDSWCVPRSDDQNEYNKTVNAILKMLDKLNDYPSIYFIAATNIAYLDNAFKQRMWNIIEFVNPDDVNRKMTFQKLGNKSGIIFTEEEIKQLVTSTEGMSYRDIEIIVRSAGHTANAFEKMKSTIEVRKKNIKNDKNKLEEEYLRKQTELLEEEKKAKIAQTKLAEEEIRHLRETERHNEKIFQEQKKTNNINRAIFGVVGVVGMGLRLLNNH